MLTTTGKSNYVVQQVHLQLKYSEPLQNIALAFQSNITGRYLIKLQWQVTLSELTGDVL